MIYSSSYIYAKEVFGSSLYFLNKQVFFVLLSLTLVFFLSKTKFSFWYKNSYVFHVLFSIMLILCFIPGFSLEIKGATRWIKIGGFTLQPGEFVKYSTLLCSVHFFNHFTLWDFRERMIRLFIIVLPFALLLMQPDFGMLALCVMNLVFACFFSEVPRRWFYSIFSTLIILLSGLVVMAPYRVKRLMSYLDPWSDPMNSGFQVIQSFLAFALGGFWGSGVGNSKEKLFYLPEAHNDFIFSVIGEELGFWGTFLVIMHFISFTYLGLKLATNVKIKAKSIFAATAIISICMQAVINMAVVLGLLPTKGLNLPFISAGGSSLLANALLLGLFFSVICKNEVSTEAAYKN